MITHFDSLFAGHVDVENVGYRGTPVNDRSYSDEYLATAFDKSLAIAQLMDRTGYDTLWLAEHHFQPEGFECIPNVLMLSVHLAHQTERINFGCGFNITPMWHPLRLAEDYAAADIFTKGRVIFGVGEGITPVKSRPSALPCWTRALTGTSSRSRWTSSSRPLRSGPSPIVAATTNCRRRCHIGATI